MQVSTILSGECILNAAAQAALSEEQKKLLAKRAARFGIAEKPAKTTKVDVQLTAEEEQIRAKRAARFGKVKSAAAVDPEEEARRAARAARFAAASS